MAPAMTAADVMNMAMAFGAMALAMLVAIVYVVVAALKEQTRTR
jgi:hypothetical protein